jgi:mono/diheme cytochrome c family protein
MRASLRVAVALFVAVAGSALLVGGYATPAAQAFPTDQLARGEEVWNAVCVRCHGPGSDNPDAPLLQRPGAFRSYANAADLFQYVQGSMPADEPMTLQDQQYWDVLAFLLSQQGITSGTPLGPDNAATVPTS